MSAVEKCRDRTGETGHTTRVVLYQPRSMYRVPVRMMMGWTLLSGQTRYLEYRLLELLDAGKRSPAKALMHPTDPRPNPAVQTFALHRSNSPTRAAVAASKIRLLGLSLPLTKGDDIALAINSARLRRQAEGGRNVPYTSQSRNEELASFDSTRRISAAARRRSPP